MFECIVLFLYIIKSFYNVLADIMLLPIEQSQLPYSSFRITKYFELSFVILFFAFMNTYSLFIYENITVAIHKTVYNNAHF